MRGTAILAAAILIAAAPLDAPLAAQAPDRLETAPGAPSFDQDTLRPAITPRGAFIRSLILPGWGQSEFEAYFRGGIYFAGWGGNWYMNFRNQVRLTEARNRLDIRREQIRDELIAAAPNPDSMRAVLDTTNVLDLAVREDPLGGDLRGLVRSREQQREDWIALTIGWILASGVDAYVTAHLADFPVGIDIERNADRSVSLRVDIPLPRRRP